MVIYTIGFTQKSAQDFFESISGEDIKLLIDTRLNNNSQLAGFSKKKDLPYFLEKLSNCQYSHQIEYAPTKELLDSYRKKELMWDQYEKMYRKLIKTRGVLEHFKRNFGQYSKVVLLCSESASINCHRRVLAEEISNAFGYEVKHL